MIALAAGLSGYGLYQRTVEMPRTRAEYAADPEGTLREAGFWFPPARPSGNTSRAACKTTSRSPPSP